MKLPKDQAGVAPLIIVVVLLVLAVVGYTGYRVFSNKPAAKTSGTNAATSKSKDSEDITAAKVAANEDAANNPDKTFELVVADNKKLASGPSTINVSKGDAVRVNIKATGEEAEVHLDGYDITTEADKDAPGGFTFIADQTGTFKFYSVKDVDGEPTGEVVAQLGTVVVK